MRKKIEYLKHDRAVERFEKDECWISIPGCSICEEIQADGDEKDDDYLWPVLKEKKSFLNNFIGGAERKKSF